MASLTKLPTGATKILVLNKSVHGSYANEQYFIGKSAGQFFVITFVDSTLTESVDVNELKKTMIQ